MPEKYSALLNGIIRYVIALEESKPHVIVFAGSVLIYCSFNWKVRVQLFELPRPVKRVGESAEGDFTHIGALELRSVLKPLPGSGIEPGATVLGTE